MIKTIAFSLILNILNITELPEVFMTLGIKLRHVLSFFTLCVQRSWTTLAGVSPVTVIASEPCS